MKEELKGFFLAFQKEDYYFFPFLRIFIAVFFIVHFLGTYKDYDLLFGTESIIPLKLRELHSVPFIPRLTDYYELFRSIRISNITAFSIYEISYIIICLLILVGLFTRGATICLLIVHLLIVQSGNIYMYGLDTFKTIILFYGCIFPMGNLISIDNLIFKRNKIINPTSYRRLLQLHVCLIYFFSGLDKLIGFNWRNGESIWKAINLPHFKVSYINYDFMINYPIIPLIIGWSVVLIELLYVYFIWNKKTRFMWISFTILMHVGIIVFLKLYFFGFFMIFLNLLAFMNLDKENKL